MKKAEKKAARHITQMELARLLGISQTHLSNIEKGRVQISLRLLVKMANIFNCRLDDFFGMSECLSEPEYESSYRKKKWQITYYKQIYEEEGLQGLLEQL